jgi:endo-1,4-beta-xylanase
MGFSAGGEVAALVCRHPDKGQQGADDPVERQSCRPDFQALVYSGPQGIVRQTVSKDTPPTFIVVGEDDRTQQWLVEHFQALRKAGVSSELHVYAKIPHGFGYRPNQTSRPVDAWLQRFLEFLGVEGMLKSEPEAGKTSAR